MIPLRDGRRRLGISQREFAARSDVAFRTIQLIEKGEHDARLSTLTKIARALGCPGTGVNSAVEHALEPAGDSLASASALIAQGEESRRDSKRPRSGLDEESRRDSNWKQPFFDFVDAFRRTPGPGLVAQPPEPGLSDRMQALLACAAEELCAEQGIAPPLWCAGVRPLAQPWFLAGMESLKASALMESPARFRRRNIFVLANFLERA
ncbi:MAG: helix-turn-helix transcriptional regulator [Elusimicrobiota bacterium]|jgi:transcriptional regulator with XRE-family HTH domain